MDIRNCPKCGKTFKKEDYEYEIHIKNCTGTDDTSPERVERIRRTLDRVEEIQRQLFSTGQPEEMKFFIKEVIGAVRSTKFVQRVKELKSYLQGEISSSELIPYPKRDEIVKKKFKEIVGN